MYKYGEVCQVLYRPGQNTKNLTQGVSSVKMCVDFACLLMYATVI